MTEPGNPETAVPEHSDPALLAARERSLELTERIVELRDSYYERDASLVSDSEYDALVQALEAIEREHPELRGQDSPTQTVGGRVAAQFDPVTHAERMLSLDNVFSLDELREWAAKTEESAGRPVQWLTELKIDGLAISLRYEHGVRTSAATRGDGRVGEDVPSNALRVVGMPERLRGEGHPAIVEVRGEVFIPVAAFERLNALQAELRDRAVADARARADARKTGGEFDEEKAALWPHLAGWALVATAVIGLQHMAGHARAWHQVQWGLQQRRWRSALKCWTHLLHRRAESGAPRRLV